MEEEGYRTGPPGYIGWRNSFLGIDSGAPYTFKNTSSEYSVFSPVAGIGTSPTPHPQANVPPSVFWEEGLTRWRERGWESPNSAIPKRVHTLWYSLYTLYSTYFVLLPLTPPALYPLFLYITSLSSKLFFSFYRLSM